MDKKIFKEDIRYYQWGISMMRYSGWTLTIMMLCILIFSPYANSVTFITSEISSHDSYAYIIPDYLNDWYVKNSSSIHDTEISTSSNTHEQTITIESYSNQLHCDMDGPMDSPWPMYGHDAYHTCRSPYSTENNTGVEIWRVRGDRAGAVWGSAIMDNDGIIYFGTKGSDSSLYAMYLNGTRKWRFNATDLIWGTPAISINGIIFFTTWGQYFHAVYLNGTECWRFKQDSISTSSVNIGGGGTLYFGTDGYKIFAVNPDGTEKWRYTTGHIVMGSPAIGHDGTIYIGSSDNYLYALYPNGTLRWRYKTGSYIKGSASIAPDGAIYVPSFDGYLYALYPNGTIKWQASTGGSVAAVGVALAEDGTIYVGTEQLRAFNPDGTLKWTTNVQGSIYGTVPAISADSTIYVSAGGSLVAVNPDGTEKWRKTLSNEQIRSSPSIGENDRIYVGSTYRDYGYLHAFGLGPLRAEAYGPYHGAMTEPLQFSGEAFGGTPPYTTYYWDFGDDNTSDEQNPTHIYIHRGNYTATLTVTDSQGNHSQDTAQVTIGYPLPKISIVKPQNAVYFFNIKILPWRYPVVFGPLLVKAEASQVEIEIDRVEFYDEGTLIKTDYTQPYDCLWRAHPPPILHSIMVRAYDIEGNQNSVTIYPNKWF